MIYLITGAPGTGKTAHALTLLQTLPQYPDQVVVIGVKDYKGKGQYFETLDDDFPFESYAGYCFLIDEAQDYWPSRVAGRPAPESLTFLPKHRHIGQDYILTCQFPTQLDVKLRHLVGRHIHLQKEALGVFLYESGSCQDNVKDFPPDSKRPRGSISEATKNIYNSMEGEETKLQGSRPRLPLKLWLVLGVVLSMMGLATFYLFKSDNIIKQFVIGKDDPKQETMTGEFDPIGDIGRKMEPNKREQENKQEIKPLRLIRHPAELQAGNTDFPELAPQPRIPVSCVKSIKKCSCFDQNTQLIKGMSNERCTSLVSGQDGLVSSWGRNDVPQLQQNPVYVPPLKHIQKKEKEEEQQFSVGIPVASPEPIPPPLPIASQTAHPAHK